MNAAAFPPYIIQTLTALNTAGHQAYAVGGCIRDSLLGKIPDDWDVCTSALPEETMEVFGESALPTGLKHGTVTVKHGKQQVEITTFRTEGAYSDHRRPDSVRFVADVKEDLARRDFTINAMAMGLDGVLIDPFGGENDLKSGIIRCVGEANVRFEEDALRIYRALRFSAKLGFAIEEKTLYAIYEKAPLCTALTPERIRSELLKTLCFPCAKAVKTLFQGGLLPPLEGQPDSCLMRLETLPNETALRLSGLCAILEQFGSVDSEFFLHSMRCSTEHIRLCSRGAKAAVKGLPRDTVGLKHLLYTLGGDTVRCAFAAGITLGTETTFKSLNAVIESGECWQLSVLNIKGGNLLPLGYKGRELGAALNKLLFHVMEHPEDNVRERLLELL